MGKRLYKSTEDRAVSGVCGGIGEYFDIDSVIVRLVFVILAFMGVGIVAYIAAAIIIPQRPYGHYNGGYESMGQPMGDGPGAGPQEPSQQKEQASGNWGSGNALLGGILILAGAYLILRRFFYFLDMSFFMAGLLVFLGIILIVKRR